MGTQVSYQDPDGTLNIVKFEAALVEKHGELLTVFEKAEEEAKNANALSAETKSAVEGIASELNSLSDAIQELQQKTAGETDSDDVQEALGKRFLETDQCKALMEGRQGSARMDMKAAIINATGQNQPLVPSDRLSGINAVPNRMMTIRDLLPTTTTTSNLVEFVRENVFTNSAATTVAGSPQQFENVTKPESSITFTLAHEAIQTLAHWIPASKQVLDDAPQLMSYISGRLVYGLKLYEENQLLNGTGANGQLNGLRTQATAYVQSSSPHTTNEIDVIRDAIRQAQVSEYMPDAIVLNPQDWYDIEIRKVGSADDRYVIGNPRQLMGSPLWGLPVIVTNSMTSGNFLLGSFQMGAEIKDREQSSVEVSRENSDNFVKNMVTILAEERLALIVYRTESLITGTL